MAHHATRRAQGARRRRTNQHQHHRDGGGRRVHHEGIEIADHRRLAVDLGREFRKPRHRVEIPHAGHVRHRQHGIERRDHLAHAAVVRAGGAHDLGDRERDEEARPDVAQQVKHRRGFGAVLGGERIEGDHGHRHPHGADRKALNGAVEQQRLHRDIQVEGQHPDPGHGLKPEAEPHPDAWIDAAHQAGHHEAEGHADTARADHLPDQRVGKSDVRLQQRRQQHHRGEVQHAVDRHQHEADRVVAILQETRVQERLVRGEAVKQEHVERHGGDQAFDDDLGRVEPVEPNAAREHELDRGERDRQRDEAGPVEPRLPGRSIGAQRELHADQCRDTDRHQHVERPAPAVGLRQVAAEDRPEHRRDRHRHAEQAEHHLVLPARERVEQDGLRQRHHRRAASRPG